MNFYKKAFIFWNFLNFISFCFCYNTGELETKLNDLLPLLQQAKHKTMDYYRQNPESFSVIYGTDLANDYINDLIELFKN
jgi:hypothetical protein